MFTFRCVGVVALSLLVSPIAWAAPGPDETTESATYDVTLKTRGGAEYSGLFTFFGDENRPQRVEIGDLEFELIDNLDEANPGTAGSGRWISFEFFFGNFWFAIATTDNSGRLFAIGIARGERIGGKAGIYNDANIDNGRYRLSGQLLVEE